jgi:hypothetical protein
LGLHLLPVGGAQLQPAAQCDPRTRWTDPGGEFAALYAKFGRAIRRRFETPLGETSGEGEGVELKLPRIQRVDHVVCMEDIKRGERVRAVPEFLVTWIAYCLLGWIFLDLVKSFRVASFAPLCPCGAVYGWVAQGFEYRRMAR